MPEPAPPNRKKRSIPSFSEGISSPKGQSSEDGKIRAPCMIRGACAAKGALSWQDLHAVRSRKAVCGAFRMHSAHILPKPAHFGCMARESCRELAIFPSEAAFGMHGAQNLPRIAARERISRVFCHRQAPGNAPRRNLVAARPRERTAREYCHCQSGQERIRAQSCHRRTPGNASRVHFAIGKCPGNAYSQRLANGAASSCGRAYCLAIALVPHESDGLFVQAVLRTRERGALSRTWRGALNAGIRAEGADDKLAYALRQTGLHPSCRPTWASPRIDRNIDARRGTNPQAKRTSSACARLI